VDTVAFHRLHIGYPDGRTQSICLQVGKPELQPNSNWVCAVQVEGLSLEGGHFPNYGGSSWQALMVGLRFLHNLLWVEVRRGATLYSERGKYPISLAELFPFHKAES
jgi:hypothetical protein